MRNVIIGLILVTLILGAALYLMQKQKAASDRLPLNSGFFRVIDREFS